MSLTAALDFARGDADPLSIDLTCHAPTGSARCEGAVLTLCDGRSLRVRPARPADAEGVQDFVRSLSDTSRRLRFFGPIRELTPSMLAHLTGSTGRREPALVAETHDGCIAALAEYIVGDDDGTCELALVVADAWQGLGLGYALMEVLVRAAREARYLRVVADVLYGNEAMLALGRAYGFAVARSPHGSTMLRLVRDLQDPAPTDGWRSSAGGVRQTDLTPAFAVA